MSHISKLRIKHYRGIKELSQDFGNEKFIVLIGRGDSGKSTILSAINAALSPSWNLSFSGVDIGVGHTAHEHLHLHDLARVGVDVGELVAREVHHQLLARLI